MTTSQTSIDPANPPAVYNWTGPTGISFTDVRAASGCYYNDTTPREVVDILERQQSSKNLVRLFYGDSETGRDWMDEHGMVGTVGRSTGAHKIPLLVPLNSHGGPGILTDCIVRILVNGREVYRHPKYQVPAIDIYREDLFPESPWAASVNGEEGVARFKTELSAKRWAAFMQGNRMTK